MPGGTFFFLESDKMTTKLKWDDKNLKQPEKNLKKENKFGGFERSNFKNYCKATVRGKIAILINEQD